MKDTFLERKSLLFTIFLFFLVYFLYTNYEIDVFILSDINAKNVPVQVSPKQPDSEEEPLKDNFVLFDGAPRELNIEFNKFFHSKCSAWEPIIQTWSDTLLNQNISSTLPVFQEYSGLGDRLTGIQGALVNAIDLKRQLQVDWFGIDDIFEESDFIKSKAFDYSSFENKSYVAKQDHLNLDETVPGYVFRLRGNKYWSGSRETKCKDQIYWRCNKEMHRRKKCDTYNRACSSPKTCNALSTNLNFFPTPVMFVGCPLRYLLKFKKSFVESLEELSYDYRGVRIVSSYGELVKKILSEKNGTVAIHLRSGDTMIKKKNQVKEVGLVNKGYMDHTEMNSNGLTEYENILIKNSFSCKSNSLIIFASDNERLREFVRTTPSLAKRSVILNTRPVHLTDLNLLSESEEKRRELRKTFYEWFLLYLSEELITNSGHIFGISAFSRIARLFRLKARYFLVHGDFEESCSKKKFQYEGNIKKVKAICSMKR